MNELKYGISKGRVLLFCPSLSSDIVCQELVIRIQAIVAEHMEKSSLNTVVVDFSECTAWDTACIRHIGKLAQFCEERGLDLYSSRMPKKMFYFFTEHGVSNLLPDIAKPLTISS